MSESTTEPIVCGALETMQLFLDGSDGSLWKSRESWQDLFGRVDTEEICNRRFIRVSEFILWLSKYNIQLSIPTDTLSPTADQVGDLIRKS